MKVLTIPKGITHKKLHIEEDSLLLKGSGINCSILQYSDGGYDILPDGQKRGTFQSYTAFVSGKELQVEDLTIENTAGDGRLHGQAIALYSDATHVICKNVHFKGHQDTLFMSPLPLSEREKDGFKGPRQFSPRIPTTQYFENCIIEGDIDFIFGGADAIFRNCTIISLFRAPIPQLQDSLRTTASGVPVQGFICAPCTPINGKGFHFINCHFTTDHCPAGSVYLARPWRPYAKAVFQNCQFDSHIAPEKFAGWNDIHQIEETASFDIFF